MTSTASAARLIKNCVCVCVHVFVCVCVRSFLSPSSVLLLRYFMQNLKVTIHFKVYIVAHKHHQCHVRTM